MQLHLLQSSRKRKLPRRVGRGGKRGTYSGKGIKGQKARAGHRIRPALRDLLKKIPKRRGYRFHALREKPVAVNVQGLERRFAPGESVSLEALSQKGLVPTRTRRVKILGHGTLTKALTVQKLSVSASARAKIEKAGGRIITSE